MKNLKFKSGDNSFELNVPCQEYELELKPVLLNESYYPTITFPEIDTIESDFFDGLEDLNLFLFQKRDLYDLLHTILGQYGCELPHPSIMRPNFRVNSTDFLSFLSNLFGFGLIILYTDKQSYKFNCRSNKDILILVKDDYYLGLLDFNVIQDKDESESEIKPVSSGTILPSNSNLSLIHNYLSDSRLFKVRDINHALDMYSALHYEFLQFLNHQNSLGFCPPQDLLKLYFKFRHNIFGAMCKLKLGLKDFELDTDVSLIKYLPTSKKTPDFLIETDSEIKIVEFTVGNRYETIDLYKGGGNFDLKYTNESIEISKATLKSVKVFIVPAVLDSYNITEILKILDNINMTEMEPYGQFERFFEISNDNRFLINRNHILSLSEEAMNVKLIPGLTEYERPNKNKTIMVPADLLSQLNQSFSYLKTSALRQLGRKGVKLSLIYNLDTKRFYIKMQKKGADIKEFILKMDERSIPYSLSILKLEENGRRLPLSKLQGTIPVTLDQKAQSETFDIVIPTILNEDFYLLKNKMHAPELGVSEVVREEDMLSIGSNNPVNFPPDYFERLCNMDIKDMKNSNSQKMLANCNINKETLEDAVRLFDDVMNLKNGTPDNKYPKQTFQIPLATLPLKDTNLENLNLNMMKKYLTHGTGQYTKAILRKAIGKQFAVPKFNESDLSSDIRNRRTILNEANSAYFEAMKTLTGIKKYTSMSFKEKNLLKEFRANISAAQKSYREILTLSKGGTEKRLIKIPCSKKSLEYVMFRSEMAHFDKKGSQFRGIGLLSENDYLKFDVYLKKFIDRLTMKEFHNNQSRSLYNKQRLPGPKFLNDIKNNYTENWDNFFERFFKGTLIEQICELTTRLSSFLFNESVKSYNKDYVKIDNLKYDNIIIMIRGGPKIYKNQTSRLFKIFFYVDQSDLRFSGYEENPVFEVIQDVDGKTMIATPWSQIRMDSLFDYNNILPRTFLNLYSTYSRTHHTKEENMSKMSFMPFILSIHNRRKTEKFMHNSRYLIVNPLGKHANIGGIIEGFADFNYTFLDAWLRKSLSKNYLSFASKLMLVQKMPKTNIDNLISDSGITDLWLGEEIKDSDHLTVFIYITYMMTKAPVNSSIEQASNLWEILEDVYEFNEKHSDVKKLEDMSLRFDVLKFDESVYEDDFKYDPVYCQYLGHYLAGYMSNLVHPIEISNHWSGLKNQDLDSIANSNGLRGWEKSNFFNKKGYEVVYQKIDEVLSDELLSDKIQNYLDSDLTTANEMIRSDRIKLEEAKLEDLLFHVVHKIQRGGGREIFCMDLNTKVQQNPLEKMFKFLCKRIPNEFISIPSNKRHAIIHSDFYEKGQKGWCKQINRWVLDCRRWAPHSVFQKYVHFITGLSSILPADFVNQFNEFADKMFDKKFLTREHVISKMRNNVRFQKYSHLVKKMENIADGFCFTVQFSFVMGIFNYLSTLLHAANQLLATEIIRNINLRENQGLVILDAKCHSDDSVVSSYHENKSSERTTFLLYDWLLKGANHMLSVKKSQINENVYLEFLSILYLFDRFLPVIPKFSSNIPFKPSDRGYSSDITFSITQSIEMLSQGGSFEECFLITKLTEKYIQNVYNMAYNPTQPFNLLGCIDSHPLELLYAGGNADLFRSLKYNPTETWRNLNFLQKSGLIDYDSSEISLKWDMNARLNNKMKKFVSKYETILEKFNEQIPWTIANNKLGNSSLNILWYVNKLKDRHFYSSLVDEPIARKFSRIFGAAGYRTLKTKEGIQVKVSSLCVTLRSLGEIPEISDDADEKLMSYLDIVCRDLHSFYESLEGTEILDMLPSNIKEKPILFKQGESLLGNINISSSEYVTYVKEPNGYKLLGKRNNPFRDVEKITSHLKMIGFDPELYSPDQLYSVCRRVLREDSRQYRLVAAVPSDLRRVEHYSDVIKLLENNSFKHKKLIIKNKSAQRMDWDKKIIHGHVPASVVEFMSLNWTCNILEKYNLKQYSNIYLQDPWEIKNLMVKDLSEDWRPIVQNTAIDENMPLVNTTFWSHWSKEQTKIANSWFGSGKCLLSLPEIFLEVTLTNGAVDDLKFETNHTGAFSLASSWYLNTFFRFSGVNAEMIDAAFANPNQIYLCYNSKDAVFGVGHAKGYDMIFSQSNKKYDLIPSFCYKELKREKKGNNFVYFDSELSLSYKISFFVPMDEPATVDFQRFLNMDQVKQMSENKDIKKFIESMSLKEMGIVRLNKEAFFDNIGRSLIYHVLYNHPLSTSYYRGDNVEGEPILESLMAWKSINKDFGFPSEDELEQFLVRKDMPPLPSKIYNMLVKMGKSQISDEDFKGILFKTMTLRGEDRMQYLATHYSLLSSDYQNQSLTLIMRSTRIYSSCKWLEGKSFNITVPIIDNICKAIELGNVYSAKLQTYKLQFESYQSGKYSISQLFKILGTRVIMNSISVASLFCYMDPLFHTFFSVLEDLVDNGLLTWLNLCTDTDPILRTIEFQVDKKTFLDWIVDIFDCAYKENDHGYRKSKGNIMKLFGANGIFSKEMGPLRSIAVKMKQSSIPDELRLIHKEKVKNRWVKRSETVYKDRFETISKSDAKAGYTQGEFFPFDEDSQEEFHWGFRTDPDVMEFCEFDKNAKIPKFGYSESFYLDFLNLTSVRGTAWNMFVGCQILNKNLFKAHGFLKIYKKQNISTVPLKYFTQNNNFIVYCGKENFKGSIEGYSELSWEQSVRYGNIKILGEQSLELEGKTYDKFEVFSQPRLIGKLQTLNSYFSRISSEMVLEEATKVEDKIEEMEDLFELSPDMKIEKSILMKKVEEYRKSVGSNTKEVIDRKEKNSKSEETFNLIDSLGKVFSKYEKGSTGLKIKKNTLGQSIEQELNLYKFKKPLQALTEIRFKAEFETLFPGMWEPYVNNELSITRQSMKHRLEFAQIRIDRMPEMMRNKYRKLLLITSMFLSSIPKTRTMNSKSMELGYIIDSIFETDMEDDIEQIRIGVDLNPEELISLNYNLSFL
jgi:hypothetical protein